MFPVESIATENANLTRWCLECEPVISIAWLVLACGYWTGTPHSV